MTRAAAGMMPGMRSPAPESRSVVETAASLRSPRRIPCRASPLQPQTRCSIPFLPGRTAISPLSDLGQIVAGDRHFMIEGGDLPAQIAVNRPSRESNAQTQQERQHSVAKEPLQPCQGRRFFGAQTIETRDNPNAAPKSPKSRRGSGNRSQPAQPSPHLMPHRGGLSHRGQCRRFYREPVAHSFTDTIKCRKVPARRLTSSSPASRASPAPREKPPAAPPTTPSESPPPAPHESGP